MEKMKLSVAYLTHRLGYLPVYEIPSILYLAEKMSLEEWGRPIFSDRYIATIEGSICSGVKAFCNTILVSQQFLGFFTDLSSVSVKASSDYYPESDYFLEFSESDIEILDWVAMNYKYGEGIYWVKENTKDAAWADAVSSSLVSNNIRTIPLVDFKILCLSLRDGEALWSYVCEGK